MPTDPYADLGIGYSQHRRPDVRIAAMITAGLGRARTVVNVGAGAGSYEPTNREVVAVEPSSTMIAQRAPGAPPVVQAYAENLPFADHEFDVGLAVLTVHHWDDPIAGLAELQRVSRRQVVLTWDPDVMHKMWLIADYLPEIVEVEQSLITLRHIREALAPADVCPIPVPWDCTDGFLAAYWRRPHCYLDPAIRTGVSSLSHLTRDVLDPAMDKLADDLANRRWMHQHGWVLQHSTLDVGYRLVIADQDARSIS